ncbi:MAG TPA: MraY family glycosyltransferase [Candidatus Acidoferrales bacterium]|nr:MraY family glycosyltransferase [Candidatus Acidoferrales bacterium]
MRTYILILVVSSTLSYLVTLWLSRVAAERGWARREDERGGAAGVPRLGGLAIFVAILVSLAAALLLRNMVTDRLLAVGKLGVALTFACLAVFALGLYDDLKGARPWQKLAVQTFAAVALYSFGFRVDILSNPFTHTPIHLGILGLPLTVLWLAAISNAFNLIDGLDGLAAGVGLFAAVSLFLLAALGSNVFVAAVAASVAGALLGFLPHNFHPARIYLGDSGSLTAGLVLAALSIVSEQKGPVMVTMAIPLLIFGLPLLEVAVTTSRRLLSGHPLFGRDEDHLHHRLLKVGVAKRIALLVLYGLAALFALSSILLVNYSGSVAPLIAVLCGAFAWIVVNQMRYPEFTELDAHIRLSLASQPAVLRNQIAIRKTAASFESAGTAREVWDCLSSLLDQLGFAEARCELRTADGDLANEFIWEALSPAVTGAAALRTAGYRAGSMWSMEIPVYGAGGANGIVRLGHAFDRRAPLFRMQSLVELISEPFAAALFARVNDSRVPVPAVEPAPLAPAQLKAAAGVRR